jgi:DNA invertase Pin-like site-specific DNA recombinase
MVFDGAAKDPIQMAVRDALIAFMAATAQAQAEAAKEARRAGIKHAKEAGGRYRGRKPTYDRKALAVVTDMLASGTSGTTAIAKTAGLSRQTVLRIKSDLAGAEAALANWDNRLRHSPHVPS